MSRRERFNVVESKAVGGVWMPILLKEHVVVHLPRSKPIHNLVTIQVTAITQGKVSPADLRIEFPQNTNFVDAIRKVRFVGDKNGQPIGPVEPISKR